jgi:hypothetical protein
MTAVSRDTGEHEHGYCRAWGRPDFHIGHTHDPPPCPKAPPHTLSSFVFTAVVLGRLVFTNVIAAVASSMATSDTRHTEPTAEQSESWEQRMVASPWQLWRKHTRTLKHTHRAGTRRHTRGKAWEFESKGEGREAGRGEGERAGGKDMHPAHARTCAAGGSHGGGRG